MATNDGIKKGQIVEINLAYCPEQLRAVSCCHRWLAGRWLQLFPVLLVALARSLKRMRNVGDGCTREGLHQTIGCVRASSQNRQAESCEPGSGTFHRADAGY